MNYSILLAAEEQTFFEQWGLFLGLLTVLIVVAGLYLFKTFNEKRQVAEMAETLKVGDKVKTYFGMFGKIVKITETTIGKVVTLEIAKDTFMDVDIYCIYMLDTKENIANDKNLAQAVEPAQKKSEGVRKKTQTEDKVKEEKKDGITRKKKSGSKSGSKAS